MKTWFWGLHRQLFKKSITLLEQLKRHWIRIDVGRRFPGVSSSICTKDGRENDKGRPGEATKAGRIPRSSPPRAHHRLFMERTWNSYGFRKFRWYNDRTEEGTAGYSGRGHLWWKGENEEDALDYALSQVNNISKKRLLGNLQELKTQLFRLAFKK